MPNIKIRVGRTGEIKISTHGFVGSACKTAVQDLERYIGGQQLEMQETEEYFQEVEREVQVEQHDTGQ